MQNPQQLEAILRRMPDEYLAQEMQRPSGRVPQFLVMAEMQRRKQLRQSARGAQAEGDPMTVADDTMQGIAALPAENMGNVPDQGVVGMAEGGFLPFGGFGQERTPPSLTAMERARLREERRQRIAEETAAVRERLARERENQPVYPGPMERVREMFSEMDAPDPVRLGPDNTFLTPERTEAAARAMAEGREPMTDTLKRGATAVGRTLSGIPSALAGNEDGSELPLLHPSNITPFDPSRYEGMGRRLWNLTLPGAAQGLGSWLYDNLPERKARVDEYGRTVPILRGDAEGTVRPGDAAQPVGDDEHLEGAPIPVPLVPEGTVPAEQTVPGVPDAAPGGGGGGGGGGSGSAPGRIAMSGLASIAPTAVPELDSQYFTQDPRTAEQDMARRREILELAGVTGDPGQRMSDYLARQEQELSGRRDSRMGNALMNAGLAMMAGESPHFFTNVGRGLQQGVTDYRESGREIDRIERENMDLAAQIEAAQRSERTAMADSALAAEQRREGENFMGKQAWALADHETKVKAAEMANRLKMVEMQVGATLRAAQMRSAGAGKDDIRATQLRMAEKVISDWQDLVKPVVADKTFTPDLERSLLQGRASLLRRAAPLKHIFGELGYESLDEALSWPIDTQR